MTNVIQLTDSYKFSMANQYPPGTEKVFSYIESRGGKWGMNVFFGPQIFLKNYLAAPITRADIEEAAENVGLHGLEFNRLGWEHILNVHGGHLPLEIKAVAEGTVVSGHNVLMTIENTDPACWWLTTALETAMLRNVWYGTTVATNSWHCKLHIATALQKSSDDPKGQIGFKLHDFGARGVSSHESAIIGGAAHLVNFMGTDTFECLPEIYRIYGERMAGFSIPAAEHSTMTSWGRDHEIDAYRNMLKLFAKPGGLVAVVSDSYDLFSAISNIWGDKLRQEVIDSGATVVIRPDSGDPAIVPVQAIEILAEKFGFSLNTKGYKVLPPSVRVIQGDGICEETIRTILDNVMAAGFSADNIGFGMGGALGQMVNRDTLRFAMKCSAVQVNGVWRDVYKDPITQPDKKSKKGRLTLIAGEVCDFQTVPLEGNEDKSVLATVWRNGELLIDHKFADIRARAAIIFDQMAP